jgi:3-hydroxybutyryl-CoA dehydrogenase
MKRLMKKDDVRKIAVIGAGTMGHGIAQSFAQGGYQVTLMDSFAPSLERARSLIASSLNAMAAEQFVEKKNIDDIIGRITFAASLEEAARDADIVFECVVEDAAVKKEVFARLDALCPPHSLLASNTTFLNIFDIVETSRPDKVLLAHWYAPPQIIPLVDVVKGPETDQASVDLMSEVLRGINKKPAVFSRFVPGYLVSRLQFALQREVFYLLDNGYLSPEELDEAAKWGLALRMMVVGLVQRIDFGGLDLTARNLEKPSFAPTPLDYKPRKIFELVQQGSLGVKSGKGFYDYKGRSEAEVCADRDAKLLKMLKFLKML